jgi:hypothetical protein
MQLDIQLNGLGMQEVLMSLKGALVRVSAFELVETLVGWFVWLLECLIRL